MREYPMFYTLVLSLLLCINTVYAAESADNKQNTIIALQYMLKTLPQDLQNLPCTQNLSRCSHIQILEATALTAPTLISQNISINLIKDSLSVNFLHDNAELSTRLELNTLDLYCPIKIKLKPLITELSAARQEWQPTIAFLIESIFTIHKLTFQYQNTSIQERLISLLTPIPAAPPLHLSTQYSLSNPLTDLLQRYAQNHPQSDICNTHNIIFQTPQDQCLKLLNITYTDALKASIPCAPLEPILQALKTWPLHFTQKEYLIAFSLADILAPQYNVSIDSIKYEESFSLAQANLYTDCRNCGIASPFILYAKKRQSPPSFFFLSGQWPTEPITEQTLLATIHKTFCYLNNIPLHHTRT